MMAITEEHYPTNGHGLMVTAIPSMQMEKYANCITPDGYEVNADGRWTVNGVVQFIEGKGIITTATTPGSGKVSGGITRGGGGSGGGGGGGGSHSSGGSSSEEEVPVAEVAPEEEVPVAEAVLAEEVPVGVTEVLMTPRRLSRKLKALNLQKDVKASAWNF